jgi:hypothetical protein
MGALSDALADPAKKATIVEDCLELLDAEVKDKSGLSGLAVKAGYAAVKGIRPGFIKQVVTDLLPEFAQGIDPIWQEGKDAGKSTPEHFNANSGRVADALLAITDEKAKRAKSGVVKSTYEKLRGTAKKNVEAAVPRLGKLIEKHVG